jgi:hypothetical protein
VPLIRHPPEVPEKRKKKCFWKDGHNRAEFTLIFTLLMTPRIITPSQRKIATLTNFSKPNFDTNSTNSYETYKVNGDLQILFYFFIPKNYLLTKAFYKFLLAWIIAEIQCFKILPQLCRNLDPVSKIGHSTVVFNNNSTTLYLYINFRTMLHIPIEISSEKRWLIKCNTITMVLNEQECHLVWQQWLFEIK